MAETITLTIAEAEAFLADHGRHYTAPAEKIAAIGLSENGILHGAAILGRTEEGHGIVAHIYADGTWHAYSLLYGACYRAFAALGYELIRLRKSMV